MINMSEKSEIMKGDYSDRLDALLKQNDPLKVWEEICVSLHAETLTTENCFPWLGRVAVFLKQSGYLEKGIELLEKYCDLCGDDGDRIALKLWRQELSRSSWSMARKDSKRTSQAFLPGEKQPMSFVMMWEKLFPFGSLAKEAVWNLPAPIIAYDLLITFNSTMQGFVGWDLSSGRLIWESGVIAACLEYAMTPVYLDPYLYFLTPGSIRRKSIRGSNNPMEVLTTSKDLHPYLYAAPLAWGKTFVTVVPGQIFLYNHGSGQSRWYPMSLKDQEHLQMPVVCNHDLYILSNRGRLFRLSQDYKLEIVSNLSDQKMIYGAPVVVAEKIYFECVTPQGVRQIGCYNFQEAKVYLKKLEEEICSVTHTHLNFPPIAGDNSVFFCSDNHTRLYQAQQLGEVLEVIPIQMFTQNSGILLNQLPQFYSFMLHNIFLSKNNTGFSYINTFNGKANMVAFLPHRWEIISQPISYGNKLLIVCKEGIKCYEII